MAAAIASLLALIAAALAVRQQQSPPQMNNIQYTIANSPTDSDVRGYRGEYFDILSPVIRYRYSEVFWVMQDEVPIPPEIVKRYNNSVMSVTGYEFDVLRRNAAGEFEPVPCYEHYNHHYIVYMRGRDSKMVAMKTSEHSAHMPMGATWDIPVGMPSDDANDADIPAVQYFSESNGNEGRRSYHGYPLDYGQIIASPVSVIPNPMMINTKSPDGSRNGGPQPRTSQAPPNATYSGLVECPCSTRVKRGPPQYGTQSSGTCANPVTHLDACMSAAARLGLGLNVTRNETVSDPSLPSACSLLVTGATATVTYNSAASSVHCGAGATNTSVATGQASSLVDIHIKIDGGQNRVLLTLAGPASVWFGVGFGATVMADHPYTIVIDGNGNVQERVLADHAPGTVLAPLVRVVSSTVASGRRVVVLSRPLAGPSAAYYTFSATEPTIQFINAVGSGAAFAYHASRTAGQLNLVIPGVRTCVCMTSSGTFNNIPFGEHCYGEVLAQQNTACFAETFNGGLPCCYHLQSLLDEDQPIPPAYDEIYMKFRFYYEDYVPQRTKNLFRLFWMTETWQNEYDVPKADPTTPPQDRVHELTSVFKFGQMMYGGMSGGWNCSFRTDVNCADPSRVTSKGVNIIYAGGHCHAPACIEMELYNMDTGQLVCRNKAVYGVTDQIYDEIGYMHIPPCVWGSAEEGLQPPPPFQLDTNMLSIARYNSTYKHYGVMAFWQMRGAYVV